MEFRILGPLEAVQGNELIALGGPRQRAVLARLLLDPGRVVRADALIEDVWDGRPPPTAPKTLQKYISELRKVVGATMLRTDRGGYALDIAPIAIDAHHFEQLVANGAHAEALALWRGDVLADLSGYAFIHPTRTRLEELRLVALEHRLEEELVNGRHAQAVGELNALVAAFPLRERLTSLLMLALYRSGRQVEAMRIFERHRRRLAEEVGMAPSSELRELERAILEQDPALDGSAPPAQSDGTPAGPSPVRLPAAALLHADRPFVGRDRDLHVLDEALRAAIDGTRRLVLLSGEAGIGKTRLAAQFARRAHANGAIVLWGRATSSRGLPYEPIIGALRTVLHAVSPEARARVVEGRPALGILVPDMAGPVRLDSDVDRFVVFETVAELLESETTALPIVFVLDDLHWADELSVRLMDHLLRHDRAARLVPIATLRTTPVDSGAHVDTFLADLQRDGLLIRVPLPGLDERDVTALLDARGWANAEAAASAIHRATAGNAFFVTELADGPHVLTADLPASLREVLNARLERLDPCTQRLIALSAVAGGLPPLPVLAEAAQLDASELVDAIDEAVAAGVLAEDGTDGEIGFRHALVAQAALDRLNRSRRKALHLGLAHALARSPRAPAADIARHFVSAGALASADEVVAATITAGHASLDVLAYEDAMRWAAHGCERAEHASDLLACQANLLFSTAARALGRRSEARDSAWRAAELARGANDAQLLASAAESVALARAGLGFDFGTRDPALESLLGDALDALPDGEDEQRARLLGARLAEAATRRDRAALSHLDTTATQLGLMARYPALAATANLAWRMANWRRDLLDERIAADEIGLARAEQAGNLTLELNALLYGIADLFEAGRLDEAHEWFDRFRDGAARLRQPVYESFALSIASTWCLLSGEYDRSAALANEALEVGRESHGANAVQAWVGNQLVRTFDSGRLGEAVELTARATTEYAGQPVWRIVHASACAAAGDDAPGREVLAALVHDEEVDAVDDSLWGLGLALLVELAYALADRRAARVLWQTLAPYSGRFIVNGMARATLGPIARYAGLAAHVAGENDAAESLLATAERQSRAVGALPSLARALYDRALVQARRGNPTAAKESRDEADEIAARIGLTLGGLSPKPRN